jgi:hypothetical protein
LGRTSLLVKVSHLSVGMLAGGVRGGVLHEAR